jgi:ATP-dependent Lhr-like helicase
MTDYRELLPRTWYAFLARFPQPRPIQTAAMGPLTEGKNVLLASATASGKTEAYAAPLVERCYEALKAGQPALLIVSPTRALVNDLARRLEAPLERCGLQLTRRTGDHTSNLEDRPGVLLTTPESLDSLLCRHPRWLAPVRAVVLDELHVLTPSCRGSQLLFLLERLQRVVTATGGPTVQRVAASATVGWARQLADRYLGPESEVAAEAGGRELDYAEAEAEELREAVTTSGARKVLLFTPSRARAEGLAGELTGQPPFGRCVLVHHASLSRPERERVEKAFLSSPTALVLATNTLELGVDIGDVDLVATLGPPADVSSLLQRAGRGNRRSGRCRLLGLWETPSQRVRLAHLVRCAKEGRLLEPWPALWSSVLVQQAFSLVYQNPGRVLTAEALEQRCPPELRRDSEELLARLVERGWFEAAGSRYKPAAKLERLYERGLIHTNLDSGGGSVEVVDAHTGRVVGQLQPDREGKLPDQVSLGGRTRKLGPTRGRQVAATALEGPGEARFVSRGRAPMSHPLAHDLAAYLGQPPGLSYLELEDDELILGHFQGTARGLLLAEWVRSRKAVKKVCFSPCVLRVYGKWRPQDLDPEELARLLPRVAARLGKELGAGPWAAELPPGWLAQDLAQGMELAAWTGQLQAQPAEEFEVLRWFNEEVIERGGPAVRNFDPGW